MSHALLLRARNRVAPGTRHDRTRQLPSASPRLCHRFHPFRHRHHPARPRLPTAFMPASPPCSTSASPATSNNTTRTTTSSRSSSPQSSTGACSPGAAVDSLPANASLRIRVVSLMHRHLSLWHSIERALGYAAAFLEAGFGFFQFFIHPYRRCVQDRIAETIVVTESSYRSMQIQTRASAAAGRRPPARRASCRRVPPAATGRAATPAFHLAASLELQHQRIHIAPAPAFAAFRALHHRMLGRIEMLRRMLAHA